MDDDKVLFVRGQPMQNGINGAAGEEESDLNDEDIWDDELLVKAYEKAVSISKNTKSSDEGSKKKQKSTSEPRKKEKSKRKESATTWTVKSPCCALYSVDQRYYEATVLQAHEESRMCRVRFVGYNNEEEVSMDDMYRSNGESARIQQAILARAETGNNDEEEEEELPEIPQWEEVKPKKASSRRNLKIESADDTLFYQPPPPPPPGAFQLPKTTDEAFTSMLMSWYMTGYHTGFYQGMKYAQQNRDRLNGLKK